MTMKTNRILTHESIELLRREVRRNTWQGRLLNAVVLVVCAGVLWHVMPPAWREAVIEWWDTLAIKDGLKPELRTAGFVVPEWVAYGIVGTVVLMIIGLKAWQWIVGPEEAETLAMPPEHDRDFETVRGGDIETCRGCKWCRDPGDGYAGMIRCTHERAGKHGMLTRPSFGVLCAQHSWLADGDGINAPWMRSLKAFFEGRGVRLTNEQCVIIRAKCVPPWVTSLPFLSVYLQRELKLRLLMTTLMEIQAICMGPLQPGRAEP